MIRLLRWLLTGDAHPHKWTILREGTVLLMGGDTGKYYDCRCETCGAIKEFRT